MLWVWLPKEKYPCSRIQLCLKSEPLSALRQVGDASGRKGKLYAMVSCGQAGEPQDRERCTHCHTHTQRVGNDTSPHPALLPHKLHIQRFKLGRGLPAVLVHVGDVLGQPGRGEASMNTFFGDPHCTPSLHLALSALCVTAQQRQTFSENDHLHFNPDPP